MRHKILSSAAEALEPKTAQLATIPREDRRQASRRLINLAAALRQPGSTSASATILNVGYGGCKVRTASRLCVGDEVWIKFDGLEARRSKVVWAADDCLGCEFAVPLLHSELELVAPQQPVRPRAFRP